MEQQFVQEGHAGNHMQKLLCITATFLNTRLLFIVLTIYCFIFSNSNHVNGTEAYLDFSYNYMTNFFGKKKNFVAKIQEEDMPYVSQDEKQEIIADFFEDLLNPAGTLSLVTKILFLAIRGFLWKGQEQANGGNCLVSWDKVQIPYADLPKLYLKWLFSQNLGAYRGVFIISFLTLYFGLFGLVEMNRNSCFHYKKKCSSFLCFWGVIEVNTRIWNDMALVFGVCLSLPRHFIFWNLGLRVLSVFSSGARFLDIIDSALNRSTCKNISLLKNKLKIVVLIFLYIAISEIIGLFALKYHSHYSLCKNMFLNVADGVAGLLFPAFLEAAEDTAGDGDLYNENNCLNFMTEITRGYAAQVKI
ncbi:hypothetical protein ACJX0J_022749 [Zea mays]